MAQGVKFCLGLIAAALVGCTDTPPPMDAPAIQSNPPIIYLAANLGEEAQLGWCIDTQGRGFSESLHAHSCKPQSTDAQDSDINFRYDATSGQIRSAAFAGKCAERLQEGPVTFGLLNCNAETQAQTFRYDAASQTFHPQNDAALCLSVGETINQAGPFQSRSLILTECITTETAFKKWAVLGD